MRIGGCHPRADTSNWRLSSRQTLGKEDDDKGQNVGANGDDDPN